MAKKNTAIFDVDGTLFSSIPTILNSFAATFEKMELAFPGEEKIKALIGCGLPVIFSEFLPQGAIERAVEIYREIYLATQRKGLSSSGIEIVPGTQQALQDLANANFNIGAFTMKSCFATRELFQQAGIEQFFKIIVGFENVERSKPDPEGLEKCLDFFGVEKSQAVFVGDSLHDLQASRNGGVEFLAVTSGTAEKDDFAENGCNLIFPSVLEAGQYFLRENGES